MLAAIRSAAVHGVDAVPVLVEVDVARGMPCWTLVGLGAGAVKESRERVSAALSNSGFLLPPRRVTVNLAPADHKKEGTSYDLPIALAFLVATGQLAQECVAGLCAVGELGLDGAIRPVRGVLPVARLAAGDARTTLVVPPANVAEARLVGRARVAAPATLRELVDQLSFGALEEAPPRPAVDVEPPPAADMADIVGQVAAKRALEIAAAGEHGAMFIGPPGAGKTMLAQCLPGILPRLTDMEALEVIAIQSVAGVLSSDGVTAPRRPFRAPHHTVSTAGLIGGGPTPRPGEVSLAHRGVLFLDEMLEHSRHTLDALRQPLEEGVVVLTRAAGTVRFPARFTLVGAMNPCPCGRAGDPAGTCTCTTADVLRYRGRLSGPMADRIDLHVMVSAVPLRELSVQARGESSSTVRSRVERAREIQRVRYAGFAGTVTNGRVPGRWLLAESPVDGAARELLTSAAERLGLSARAFHRVLRVARTIADLAGEEAITVPAVSEALRYRPVEAAGSGRVPVMAG